MSLHTIYQLAYDYRALLLLISISLLVGFVIVSIQCRYIYEQLDHIYKQEENTHTILEFIIMLLSQSNYASPAKMTALINSLNDTIDKEFVTTILTGMEDNRYACTNDNMPINEKSIQNTVKHTHVDESNIGVDSNGNKLFTSIRDDKNDEDMESKEISATNLCDLINKTVNNPEKLNELLSLIKNKQKRR